MSLTLRAPVTCPECGSSFHGQWDLADGELATTPKEQKCPEGHAFTAVCPHWPFKPQTVVMSWKDAAP